MIRIHKDLPVIEFDLSKTDLVEERRQSFFDKLETLLSKTVWRSYDNRIYPKEGRANVNTAIDHLEKITRFLDIRRIPWRGRSVSIETSTRGPGILSLTADEVILTFVDPYIDPYQEAYVLRKERIL
jgi:hypothetical protein